MKITLRTILFIFLMKKGKSTFASVLIRFVVFHCFSVNIFGWFLVFALVLVLAMRRFDSFETKICKIVFH